MYSLIFISTQIHGPTHSFMHTKKKRYSHTKREKKKEKLTKKKTDKDIQPYTGAYKCINKQADKQKFACTLLYVHPNRHTHIQTQNTLTKAHTHLQTAGTKSYYHFFGLTQTKK